MAELKLKAVAHVKLTKLDDNGELIGVEETTVTLTDEEVRKLCHSQAAE